MLFLISRDLFQVEIFNYIDVGDRIHEIIRIVTNFLQNLRETLLMATNERYFRWFLINAPIESVSTAINLCEQIFGEW